jgi:chromosomal replication initiation ATPase DnaA
MTVSEMIAASAWLFCLPPDLVTGRSRHNRPLRARYAIYVALRRRGNSYGQIARWLGRDHTTIMNGVERGEALALTDAHFAGAVKKLENMGRSGLKEGSEHA